MITGFSEIERKQMSKKWKIGIPLILLAIILSTSLFGGSVETEQFSAYGACRKIALATKSQAIWKHEQTIPLVFVSWVFFSDRYNDLTCQAIGIGPFWTASGTVNSLVGCGSKIETGKGAAECPKEYFGVSP